MRNNVTPTETRRVARQVAADAQRSEPARYDSGKYDTVAVIVAGKTGDNS